jgi:hypothetical protein
MHHSRSTTGVIYVTGKGIFLFITMATLWVLPSHALDITNVLFKGLKRPERKAAYRTLGITDL